MGLLDGYKNMLQDYKTKVVDEVREKVLGEVASENLEVLQEVEDEKSFVSSGTKSIKRYAQALRYGAYGMECNACCVMYFLQSLGLIPFSIPRKSFEYLFTPLNIDDDLWAKLPKKTPKNQNGINIKGQILKPNETLFENLFVGNGKLFLRGITGGGSIFPNGANDSYQKLHTICHRFFLLSEKKGYGVLRKDRTIAAMQFSTNENVIGNCYDLLCDGSINKNYFDAGFSIFIAIDYGGTGAGHYCLIVKPFELKKKINDVTYYFYPTDDPFFEKTLVVVPSVQDSTILETLKKEVSKLGKPLKVITSTFAMGVI